MNVCAVRGAVQLDRDEREHLLAGVRELLTKVLDANGIGSEDLVSILFTSTSDLVSAFPAEAARELGLLDVPLMCARELDVSGALPRTVRLMVHARSGLARADVQHVYLGGAACLREDLEGGAQ
ncbi:MULTISPECIES: chorismate mutase [Nocardiopsis]|uniref:chorismate mutase n=1 Tax=Nocardiopsis dassonvillei (strain ATCC 23218 / DSM 43111 / CIP 107115 / JCM 7437 / KCTC 9190 / NBRC 14626 / NCTC 10488 / NRRL B-5397 / IMRU 509) TaxID=446468 RepID=D7B1Z6_NOCDD|nr:MULTISPECIES: chorismate mutase [Nocardiopsis]ADH66617.1 chorismate mutase [Nocardiopsis dassonvillei subsp. dassonvillei DSM 43111]APC34929.1 chorismate mutase [Nocardiopsis dassonvillei]NKY78962.1 chorismate mutase [Nocardiopsis dassonvillei]VEI92639.1 Chorismate mutase AroH [Nocardiopsis dassonvillei]